MINGTLIGNVGQTPELRTTPTGKKVAVFSMALNNRYTQRTTWYKIEAWNGLGEKVVMPYVKKGDQIAVTIQDMRLETWKHKQSGDARGVIVVTADQIQLLSNRRDANEAGQPDADSGYSSPPEDEDDIPF
jgi:single-strand DNA-binding protein